MRLRPLPLGIVWRSRIDRRSPTSLAGTGLVLIAAIVLAVVLSNAPLSGALQWAVGLAAVGILAMAAWRRVVRGTEEPEDLLRPASDGAIHPGDIASLSQAARRAARGLPYSQVTVSSRARAAFLERVRLTRGLSPEAIRQAETDPAALRRLVGDEVLSEFLRLGSGTFEERYRWVLRARGRDGFDREFRNVLDRMEAWR